MPPVLYLKLKNPHDGQIAQNSITRSARVTGQWLAELLNSRSDCVSEIESTPLIAKVAEGRASYALQRVRFSYPVYSDRCRCCGLGGPFDQSSDLFSPRKRRDPPVVSGQLECRAMPNAGKFSAADWPCTHPVLDGLFIRRSINGNQLAVWIFRSDIANFDALGKLCLGPPSCRPQLERARRVSAIVHADHHFPHAVVGNSILGNRVDAGGSFGAAAIPRIWGLRGARDAALNPDSGIAFPRFINRKMNKLAASSRYSRTSFRRTAGPQQALRFHDGANSHHTISRDCHPECGWRAWDHEKAN